MRSVLILGALFFYGTGLMSAHADGVDASVSMLARSYAPGFTVNPNAGYSFRTWGDPKSPLHGYLRPAATAFLNPTSVGARAELDLYPVSFFGFGVGRNWITRFADPPRYDCVGLQCQGALHTTDLSARLLFKADRFYGSVKYTKSFYDSLPGKKFAVDPALAVSVGPEKENASLWNAVVGTDFDQQWSGGVIFQFVDMTKSWDFQNSQHLYARYKRGAFTYLVGFGRFESSLLRAGASVLGAIVWTPLASTEPGR